MVGSCSKNEGQAPASVVDRVRALENVALPVPSGEMSTRVVRQATTAKRVPREGRRGDFGLAKSHLGR